MKNTARNLALLSILIIASFFINAKISEDKNAGQKSTGMYYEVKALKIPENLSFAGEKVPLNDMDVRERIDRELLVNVYWQSNTLLNFKRAHKYFPVIEPILKKYGVPDDFKYLAVIESGLLNVTSPSGAKGFWQIMPATAKEFGLEVNENVDERNHLEKSTVAACQYLLKAYEKFGSWALVAGSYNAGMAGITKVQEIQKSDSYYDLYLNTETSRYVPRIVATKEIMTNPKKYGFLFDQEDLYTLKSIKKVEVEKEILSLADFAAEHSVSYKDLKILNPWLMEPKLNNKSGKKYILDLPK
ncbi:MAG: lytic transglycosylase domain-containing protein [Flavobacteriaceae bacterium]|nr:lytic transglycosylase domain-containing protein [Flavobacteriaceae bacterium]